MSKKALVPVNVLAKAADPSGEYVGDVYYNTTDNVLKTYDGSIWSSVTAGGGAGVIIIDGGSPTTEFVANLDGGTP